MKFYLPILGVVLHPYSRPKGRGAVNTNPGGLAFSSLSRWERGWGEGKDRRGQWLTILKLMTLPLHLIGSVIQRICALRRLNCAAQSGTSNFLTAQSANAKKAARRLLKGDNRGLFNLEAPGGLSVVPPLPSSAMIFQK